VLSARLLMKESSPSRDLSLPLPRYDESEWPLLRVMMPPTALSEEAFEAHLDACSERYRRAQPFCMMIDMGSHPPLGAVQRKAVADRMMADNERFPGVMLGCALVVRSTRSRGSVTAINWIARIPYQFAAFEDADEAKRWLLGLLEEHRTAAGPTSRG
jgi:hypothetical protein